MEIYRCPMLEIGESKMGIWSDIKKAAKGSKEYQKRKKGPISKAVKQVAKDVKSAVSGSKEYQEGKAKKKAGKAKKKAGKTWTKAVKAQKKTGGPTMNELIKQRNAAEKGSEAYTKAQNQINKAYGSKKVHKATKKDAETKLTSKEKSRTSVDEYGVKSSAESGHSEERQKADKGGLVESNPYGWPTRDSSDHS